MTQVEIEYRGPSSGNSGAKTKPYQWWRKLPVSFLGFVVAPTLAAAVYFGLVATPQYVSEARFIVRQPSQPQPSGLGVALQGIGLPAGQVASGVLATAAPGAPVGYILARQMGGDADFYAAIFTWQTVLAALTLPLWLIFAGFLGA